MRRIILTVCALAIVAGCVAGARTTKPEASFKKSRKVTVAPDGTKTVEDDLDVSASGPGVSAESLKDLRVDPPEANVDGANAGGVSLRSWKPEIPKGNALFYIGGGVLVIGLGIAYLARSVGVAIAAGMIGGTVIALGYYPWLSLALFVGGGALVVWKLYHGGQAEDLNRAFVGAVKHSDDSASCEVMARLGDAMGRSAKRVESALDRAKKQSGVRSFRRGA